MAICCPLHEGAQPVLFSGPTPSFPSLESEAGTSRWGDVPSWQGTFGPRTTRLGGQLALGPHVWGDSWSGGDTWSSYNVSPKNKMATSHMVQIPTHARFPQSKKWPTYHVVVPTGNALASQRSFFRENRLKLSTFICR